MICLNERADMLRDLEAGISIKVDEMMAAPACVQETDIVAFSEAIDNMNAAKAVMHRLYEMARIDADEYNGRQDAAERNDFARHNL